MYRKGVEVNHHHEPCELELETSWRQLKRRKTRLDIVSYDDCTTAPLLLALERGETSSSVMGDITHMGLTCS